MADSTIKPDSGNDLVLQNNGGTGKIEINNDNTIAVTGTVSGITATEVGLGNVTNESKATMFTSPTFTGNVALGSNATGTFNGTVGSSATISTQDYVLAKPASTQTLTHNTWSGLILNSEEHDPNGWFNTSTYKFEPDKAGKYFVTLLVTIYSNSGTGDNELSKGVVKKNDNNASGAGEIFSSVIDMRNTAGYNFTNTASAIVDMNGSSDYLYCTVFFNVYSGSDTGKVDPAVTKFSAFRIGS